MSHLNLTALDLRITAFKSSLYQKFQIFSQKISQITKMAEKIGTLGTNCKSLHGDLFLVVNPGKNTKAPISSPNHKFHVRYFLKFPYRSKEHFFSKK